MPIPLPDKDVRDFVGIRRNFEKLAESVEPAAAAGIVGNLQLQDDAVDARVLRDDAAVNANRAVTRNHIRDGAIDGSKLDPGLVFGNGSLGNDAVDARVIAADAVGSSEIAANAVGSSELADNAVDTAAIQNNAVTVGKLDAAVPLPKRFAADVGDGVHASIAVVHNLGTRDVEVQVRDNAAPYATIVEGGVVLTRAERTDGNTVTLIFAAAPANAAYRLVVIA